MREWSCGVQYVAVVCEGGAVVCEGGAVVVGVELWCEWSIWCVSGEYGGCS